MRKIFLFLLLAMPSFAQVKQFTAPDCEFGFTYNVVSGTITSTSSTSAQRLPLSQDSSSVVGYDNRQTVCTSWTLTYWADSGLSAISLELDQAPSNGDIPGSWTIWANPAPGTVQPLSAANFGSGSFFNFTPWISVNFNSVSGTGRLWGRMVGWKPQAGTDVTAPGNSVVAASVNASKNCTGALAGNFCSYSPTQLGVNALAYGSGATTAESTIIDTRGVRAFSLLFNCSSQVTVQLNNKAEDGTTQWNNSSFLTAVAAGQTTLSVNTGGTNFATQGTLGTGVQGLPQRAISFQFANTNATAGTCTARLLLSY